MSLLMNDRLCSIVHVQVVWLGTCVASVLLGLDLGLAAGLGIELISVVLRAQLSVLWLPNFTPNFISI